jgi:hypothetical protein
MDVESSYREIWREAEHFQFTAAEDRPPNFCAHAKEFSDWMEEHCQVNEKTTAITISQWLLWLQAKYFDWLEAVPKAHRNYLGDQGHVCIYQVYVQHYHRLNLALLKAAPPPLSEPSPPAQIAGIFLGEDV